MNVQDTDQRVASALEGIEHEWVVTRDGMPTVAVAREALHDVLAALRDRAGFEANTLVTAVDHGLDADPRFEVVWQLLSITHGDRFRVTTRVAEDDAVVPTCIDLWPGAAFSERECYDMFGVRFDGHENLRRLLMPQAYGHHPLRKDFPHQGIQPDRLYREWDRERRAEWEEER